MFVQMKSQLEAHFHGEMNTLTKFKNLYFQNLWANFNQMWHKASLGEDNLIYSNAGSRLFPRRDKNEISKICWRNLKIFISRTTGLILPFAQSIIVWRGFKFYKYLPFNSQKGYDIFSLFTLLYNHSFTQRSFWWELMLPMDYFFFLKDIWCLFTSHGNVF